MTSGRPPEAPRDQTATVGSGLHAPLRLSHLMIGVAIIALAMGLTSLLVATSLYSPTFPNRLKRNVYHALAFLTLVTSILGPIGFTLERRRSPSPFRSYGGAAVLGMVVGLGLLVIRAVIFTLDDLLEAVTPFLQNTVYLQGVEQLLKRAPETLGAAILTAWVFLTITGEGRKPVGWLEWVYLGLGVVWIVTALFHDSFGMLRGYI